MSGEHTRPADIERTSMAIISRELEARGVALPQETAAIVKRVIHTTADFEYVETLRFTPDAVALGVRAVKNGVIVTDTNMAYAGISKPTLARLHGEACCVMAEPFIAETARKQGTTRAAAAMEWALETYPGAILAVGNAPTALIRIAELLEKGKRPALVIGVPVGLCQRGREQRAAVGGLPAAQVPALWPWGAKAAAM